MKNWIRRLSFGLLAMALAVWLSGCLSAKYFTMVRYDDAKDEFTVLNVYQGITAQTPGDSEYLYQVWRNRDHIIRVPNIDIFTMPAYLRMSPTEYAPINLGEAPQLLLKTKTPVALDQIRIQPGTFFLRGPDTLCYYDQVVIPGKVIDQALPLLGPAIAPDLAKAIDKELQRRKDGGKRYEWDAVRKLMLKDLHSSMIAETAPETAPATAPAPDAEPKPEFLQIVDDESLDLLSKSVAAGTMKIIRQKQIFRLMFPLSDADVKQVADTWQAALTQIKTDTPKTPATSPSVVSAVVTLLPAFKLSARPKSVELEINLAIIIEHLPMLASLTDPLEDPTPDKLKAMRETITALKARGVPIDEKLTVEQLAKDFVNKSVKAYPSEKPVEPGTDMVQAAKDQPVPPPVPVEK